MNCRNCNTPYESTPSVYQMESRNRLFCFEDVPALKCPECEHLFIPEAAVKIMLEQIAILSNGSPIPYIKWKWNKKSNIQTPDELADELLSKGSPDQEEEEKESAETDTASSPTPADKTLKKKTTAAGTGRPGVTLKPTPGDSAETVASQEKEETASDAPRTTRTKGVVVRKRKRIKADNAV